MLVKEIMTEGPVVARLTWTVEDVVRTLEELPFRHLPVVDSAGELVGIVSDRDLRRVTAKADDLTLKLPLHRRPITDLMSTGVVSVTPEDDVDTAIDAILDNQVGAVPVVNLDGGVVGIVSYVDVLRCAHGRLD